MRFTRWQKYHRYELCTCTFVLLLIEKVHEDEDDEIDGEKTGRMLLPFRSVHFLGFFFIFSVHKTEYNKWCTIQFDYRTFSVWTRCFFVLTIVRYSFFLLLLLVRVRSSARRVEHEIHASQHIQTGRQYRTLMKYVKYVHVIENRASMRE